MLTKQNRQVKDRLIVALDVSTISEARAIVTDLKDHVGMFKAGLELYASVGLALFDMMKDENIKLFFDSKLHDIPNTVAQASRNLTRQGVSMFNLHAAGGSQMMKAAREACNEVFREQESASNVLGSSSPARPYLIAVTVLTSIGADTLKKELHVNEDVTSYVCRLAKLAKESGLDGVVASAKEAKAIREACGDDFVIVTPGIRPAWSSQDDQKRIVTPGQAIKDGADFLVVGRPITADKDRRAAAERVLNEMEAAL